MLVPLYNKMIVELIKEEVDEKSQTGLIYIPNRETPYYKGKVISVGKGHYQNAKRIEMDVKAGDVVLFLKNSGLGVELDDAGMPTKVLLSDTDVFAVETEN